MIVEFLGNSGAGKSTLIPILIQLLRDDGLTAMSVTEAIHRYMRQTLLGRVVCWLAPRAWQGPILWRVFAHTTARWHTVAFVVEHIGLAGYVLMSQLRRHIPWRHRRLILRLFFKMAGQHHFFRSHLRPGEVVVFDEGFVHRAVHLFVSPSEQPDPEQVAAYLALLPRPDLVILIQAPPEACLTRIYARGLQARLRGLDEEDVARFVAHAGRVVDMTAHRLADGGWNLVTVENNGDVTASVAGLRRSLLSHGVQPE